jgi:hypothetical protein
LHAARTALAAARPAAHDTEGRRAARGDDESYFSAVVPYIVMSVLLLALILGVPVIATWLLSKLD